MNSLSTVNTQNLKSVIPQIKSYEERLQALNLWWGKISLIGKINSQNVSDSILEEMHYTRQKFSKLQERLIQNLLNAHLQKRMAEDQNKSQVAVDILIRNLFERTADVGFLATDDDIRNFLLIQNKSENDRLKMQVRLQEYVKKYSVYDEIIILDPTGKVQINLNPDNKITHSKDPLIFETLSTKQDYIETFGKSDLQPQQQHSLIYSCTIKTSNNQDAKVLGVLCLCFRFDDEMESIFNNLQSKGMTSSINIVDAKHKVIASSHPQIFELEDFLTDHESTTLVSFKQQDYLSTKSTTKGYQGFMGLSWCGQVMTPLQDAFQHTHQVSSTPNEAFTLLNSELFSDELKDIYRSSMLINDDLSLVVLNGIIAAARNSAVEFMPVLDEIKKTGQGIVSIFSDSIDNLKSTVLSSRLSDLSFYASLAVDIMDRNLYERANDVRWWALTTVFREHLQSKELSSAAKQEISNILLYINKLYTVYTNLYVYDRNGVILAVSNQDQGHFIGQQVEPKSGAAEALQVNDSQKYSVSSFAKSNQYQNNQTYIYNASITNLEQSSVIGGIGIVFDSKPEFSEMLNDTLPIDEQGKIINGCFAIYCQRDGMIVSSTENSPQGVGEIVDLDKDLLSLQNGEQHSLLVEYKGKPYAAGIAASNGYREYKTTGDYCNDILALIMLPS
ncbi:cache domain-containing protein [Paraglaciecola sp. 2405UD69-4]|uniref:cache domain-containing protein n=1 Tax=Paraglaciecola sp. 2405UD69-4 TaxID=3391836 RepID=UPI0039C8D5A6